MAKVTLEHVTKQFGEVTAVTDLTLEVQDQEFVVLVGPSGCGKSTTLRLVAGLEDLTAGSIYIGDHLVNDVAPKDRDIAMVFQSYALYPHMTVYDNMAFGLRLRGVRRPEVDRRVREAARILDVEPLLRRLPAELSGGEKQRAALGRAIVREPAVFLMDEPLSNLDAKLRGQMRTEITRLHRHLRSTVIYVTHDQTEAMTMGDRVVVMKDGVVQQVGTPRAIYERPVNAFVAGFIGSPPMNLLPCRVVDGRLVGAGFNLPVPQGRAAALGPYEGCGVVLGVRPEHISDAPKDLERWRDGVVEGQVDLVETYGAEVMLHLVLGDRTITARVDPSSQAGPGEKIRIALCPGRAHFFDAGTQKIIGG